MKDWAKAFTPEQLEIRRQRAKEWNGKNKERTKASRDEYKKLYPARIKRSARRSYLKRKGIDTDYAYRSVKRFYARQPWHKHYYAAVTRCNPNTKNAGYRKYYVNAGIKIRITSDEVKALWFRDNAALMRRPSLDRIYIAGNYSIGNCRFMEQSDNSSRRFNPDAGLVAIERRKQRYQDRLAASCAGPLTPSTP